ncbi:MAG: phytanoyl-CoA dioxygenase [Gammaproteobacteria bacterium]|nr:MAG: phytanoyl-CoA dioxygenase [Gammaproteobacteria bacterium]
MDTVTLDQTTIEDFNRDGYFVLRQFVPPDEVAALIEIVDDSLNPALAPVEYEADVHYPGAPASRKAPGGHTPRRLMCACTRHQRFRAIAEHPEVVRIMKVLLESPRIRLSQNHHNCIMTKHPGFSSVTSWHQDMRYWRFDRRELVSTWLALGSERKENGALLVIPGSHTMEFDPGQFDAALFFRTDLEENQSLLARARVVELDAGDMLFFHCRTMHAAGENTTDAIKRSLVFTYHAADNAPIPETRSAVFEDIPLD